MFDKSTKILIVDDMGTMRKLVKKACKNIGFENFEEAVNGADAWQKLNEEGAGIQLIISDWNMPECTGLDFLKRVRGSDVYNHLPFVLLTAESEASQVQEAVKAGVSNYIIKPFTAENLKQKLEAVHKKMAA